MSVHRQKSRVAVRRGRAVLRALAVATLFFSAFSAIGAGVIAVTSSAASAQTCTDTWTNSAGGNWFTAADWSLGVVPGSGGTACVTATGSYSVTMGNQGADLAGLVVGGSGSDPTLAIGNNGSGAPTVDVGTVTTSAGATISFGWDGTMTVTSFTNAGTFEVASDTAALDFTSFDNTGTFEVDTSTSYELPTSASTLTNATTGTLSVATGQILTVSSPSGQTATVTQDGVIDSYGSLYVEETVDVEGGSACGAVSVGQDSELPGNLAFIGTVIAGPSCAAGLSTDVIAVGNVTGTLSGNIPAAYTVNIGNDTSSAPATTIEGAITNAGTLSFGWDGTLTDTSTLTNAGTFEVASDTATLDLTSFDNTGTFEVDTSTTYELPSSSSTLTNATTGTLSVATGQILTVSSPSGQTATVSEEGVIDNSGSFTDLDTLSVLGGTVCDNSVHVGYDDAVGETLSFASHVASGPACAAHAPKDKLFIANIPGTLSGNVPKGWTVAIGDGGSGFANVTLSGTSTNSGTIEPGYGATVTDASALTNKGTIEVPKSVYTGTALDLAGLTNSKTILVKGSATINLPAGQTLTSGSTGTITVSKHYTLTVAADLLNQGKLTIDAGGFVKVTGTYAQVGNSSKFIPQLASHTSFGILEVTGSASLAGEIAPSLKPPSGSTYQVLTSGGLGGTTFTTVVGNFTAQYISSDSDVQLTAT
jgi:hypothetical protein